MKIILLLLLLLPVLSSSQPSSTTTFKYQLLNDGSKNSAIIPSITVGFQFAGGIDKTIDAFFLTGGFEYINAKNVGIRILLSGLKEWPEAWEMSLMIPLSVKYEDKVTSEYGSSNTIIQVQVPQRNSTILRCGAIGYPNIQRKLAFGPTTKPNFSFFYTGIGRFSYHDALIIIDDGRREVISGYLRLYFDLIWTLPSFLQYSDLQYPKGDYAPSNLKIDKTCIGFRLGVDILPPVVNMEFGYTPGVAFTSDTEINAFIPPIEPSSIGKFYFQLTFGFGLIL